MTDDWDGTVDPSSSKHQRRPPSRAQGGAVASRTVIAGLLLEIKPLAPLQAWEPVGSRLEALVSAVRGGEGISKRHVEDLRVWSNRWARLHPQVREFYLHHVPLMDERFDPARIALWRVFKGGPILEGWQYRKVYDLWIDRYGMRPMGIEVAPTNFR